MIDPRSCVILISLKIDENIEIFSRMNVMA